MARGTRFVSSLFLPLWNRTCTSPPWAHISRWFLPWPAYQMTDNQWRKALVYKLDCHGMCTPTVALIRTHYTWCRTFARLMFRILKSPHIPWLREGSRTSSKELLFVVMGAFPSLLWLTIWSCLLRAQNLARWACRPREMEIHQCLSKMVLCNSIPSS